MGNLFCEGCGRELNSVKETKTVMVDGKPMRVGVECCG